jgi:uncharacterized membrane protein YebE (DUF533 family)
MKIGKTAIWIGVGVLAIGAYMWYQKKQKAQPKPLEADKIPVKTPLGTVTVAKIPAKDLANPSGQTVAKN